MDKVQGLGSRMHLAIVLVLAAVFLAVWLEPGRAFATQGSITIASRSEAAGTYDAYCVFTADMDDDDTATHLSWASDDIKGTVLSFLDDNGYPTWLEETHRDSDCHDTPQVAAEYISREIGVALEDPDAATVEPGKDRLFAQKLARALASNECIVSETAESGVDFVGQQGYWLFVSARDSLAAVEGAGTAAIWTTLGGSQKLAVDKTSIPTIEKQVKDDENEIWGKTVDAQRNEPLSFRLIGTLPDNLDAFEHYRYRFADTFSKGLELLVPDGSDIEHALSISIDGEKVHPNGENVLIGYDQNVLTVDFADLMDQCWSSYAISSGSVICVTYQARLNGQAICGAPGNPNEVRLIYTSDPVHDCESQTKPSRNVSFTYALVIHKRDAENGEPLAGAAFTIAAADGSGTESTETLYVQADGSLSTKAHQHVTDDQGVIRIDGLDAGTYVIHECKAPAGYQQLDKDVVLTLTAQRDEQELSLTRLVASVSSEESAIEDVLVDSGEAKVRIDNAALNKPQGIENLAQTGVGPIAGALVCLGLIIVKLTPKDRERRSPNRRHSATATPWPRKSQALHFNHED